MRRLAAAALLGAPGAQTTDEAAARSCSATYRRNACVADVVEVIQLKKHERAGDCCALCLADARCAAVTYYADHKCALASTDTTTECSEGRTALRRAPAEGLCRLGGGWDRLCRDVPKRLAFALMSVNDARHSFPLAYVAWASLIAFAVGCVISRRSQPRRHQRNALAPPWIRRLAAHWSSPAYALSRPHLTLKLWTLSTLIFEALALSAPEIAVLGAPEVVELFDWRYPKPGKDVPRLIEWLLPPGMDGSMDVAKAEMRLVLLRRLMVGGWLAFLAIPPHRVASVCFAAGSIGYFGLGSVALMYNHCHNIQASLLFVVIASLAAPDLHDNERSGRWLRHCTVICILAPLYLMSGVSKIRYIGITGNLSGAWLRAKPGFPGLGGQTVARAPWARESMMVAASPFLCMMLSWGNLVVELALPLMVLLASTKARDEKWRRLTVDVFAASLVLFHLSILVLMGPNFLRMVPLLVLACDPLRREGDAPPARALPITRLDVVRGLVPVALLAWWWAVQFRADYLGVRAHGWAPGSKRGVLRRNPYWPVPLLSMFAVPRRPNFAVSVVLLVVTIVLFVRRRCSTPREREPLIELARPPSVSPRSL